MNRHTKRIPPAPSLGSEIVRDERGRIVDIYVLCLTGTAAKPLPGCVLKALAHRARKAKPALN